MKNLMRRIAFFGATGMLGAPVARELMRRGWKLRALVRDLDKARQLLGPEAELLQGDLQNGADIARCLEGAEAAYLNLSVAPASRERDFQPEREGIRNFLEAARQHPLQVVGYLSSLVQRHQGAGGFDWRAFRIKQEAAEALRQSGIPALIFEPSTFMENFDKGSYRQGKMIALSGKSLHPMYFIAAEDYARQVAEAFARFEGRSRSYAIQGLEAFTADAAAEIFVRNSPEPGLGIIRLPFGLFRLLGRLTPTFSYGAKIVEALNHYPETFEAADSWAELGKPQITLAAYAKQSSPAA
jgi:uncharacterized protein YbjT (DUF2867 family)